MQATKTRLKPHELFSLLSEPTRLRLMSFFLQTDQELCVCELVDALDIPQYRVSKHLSLLKTVGLLEARRDGTWVHYRLTSDVPPAFRDLFAVLRRDLGELYREDWRQLAKRLRLRSQGRCVVGVLSERPPKGKPRDSRRTGGSCSSSRAKRLMSPGDRK